MPSLFASPPKIPDAPPPPTVMPTENTAAITAAKQRQVTAASAASGRVSTVLTQPGNGDSGGSSDNLG